MDKPVPTPTSRIVMYTGTHARLSEDDVYGLLQGMWDNSDEWTKSHPAVNEIHHFEQRPGRPEHSPPSGRGQILQGKGFGDSRKLIP